MDVTAAARNDDIAWPATARPAIRSSWAYWLPGVALILALALAILLIVRAEWHRILDEVAATSTTLASVLADHTDRLFESADLVRLQVEEIVGDADPIVGDRDRHEQLDRLVDAVPHIVSIWVGDALGTAVSTSRQYPTPALSAADRPYFTTVRDDPDAFFVGTLTDNRYVDEVLINTSRRLATENGSFRGFIQIAINPVNIRRTFAHVRLPYQTALWLFNAQGTPLLHEPFIPSDRLAASVPRDVGIGALTGSGMFRAYSGVDGVHRRYFYTQSPQYGAYVLIAVQEDELRARWRERALPIVAFGGLLMVALGAILLFVHRERTSGLRWGVTLERLVEERTAELVEVSRARELVVQELRHRVRNAFTLIQALSRQMLASATDLAALKRDFPDRLAALAATQVLLVESNDRNSALLDELVWTELAPYRARDDAQIIVDGPPTALASRKVTVLGMMLHELATNAVKHGALSVPQGRLTVRWSLPDEQRTLCLDWIEEGGPAPAESPRKGFGSEVLDRTAKMLQAELEVDLTPDGLRARLRMPL
jgi:two-component sensor histidine kinase